MSNWKPITEEIKRKVLVTNNLESRDAFGQMSHVWIALSVHEDSKRPGKFCAFEHYTRVWDLTHYAEIPDHR